MADVFKIEKIAGPSRENVDAAPVKSFFVEMLTRDIALDDAILDLLDNCVDGVVRSSSKGGKTPYAGYWAEIKFDHGSFSIADNCGGIPKDLQKYAFKMGRDKNRPDDVSGTVGVYGIGMKRAIFKMGRHCVVSTHGKSDATEVEITPNWMGQESEWIIPVKRADRKSNYAGTTIVIEKLNSGVSAKFKDSNGSFASDLRTKISTHYAFIIDKGFEIKVNGHKVKPEPVKLIFQKSQKGRLTIEPFIFEAKIEGVEVFLAVGFTRPIPSQDAIENEMQEKRYSSSEAGWTVVCNDRTVIYHNRDELTGWGEAGVPSYHTQFIAISGIVEFRADNAKDLPTTTTKRGIDAGSPLFLQVKNKMREGMKIFTDYTYKWKAKSEESKAHMESGSLLSISELKDEVKKLKLVKTSRSFPGGKQLRPILPVPKVDVKERRIAFVKKVSEIEAVSRYLFDDPDVDPAKVGEKCFNEKLRESRR